MNYFNDENYEKEIFELNSSSVGDCTGLIPAGLNSDSELEAYNELYSFLPQPVSTEKKDLRKKSQKNQA